MKCLLFLLFGVVMPTQVVTSLPEKKEVINYLISGKPLSVSLINKLELERINASYLPLLKDTAAENAPYNIKKYYKYFKLAADSFNLRVEVLTAIAFVESYGKTDLRSSAGARGIMQMLPSAARESGLRIGYYEVKTGSKIKKIYVKGLDERINPIKSIFAAARYLARFKKTLNNREDLAIACYHMGPGNMKHVKSFSKQSNLGPSWPEIYFGVVNGSALDSCLNKLADYSKDYYFSIRAAEKLLTLERSNYLELFNKYRHVYDDRVTVEYRFYTWLCPSDAYQCAEHINEAYLRGELIEFPKNGILGYSIQSILEQEKINKTGVYLKARPEVFGLLVLINEALRAVPRSNPETLSILSLTEPIESRSAYLFQQELPVMGFGRSVVIKAMRDKVNEKNFNQIVQKLAKFGWVSKAKDLNGNYLLVLSDESRVTSFFCEIWEESAIPHKK